MATRENNKQAGHAGNLVLIADDNADVQAVLGILLRGAGFQTVTAFDGEEAVDVAAQTQPDLVLMDIVLPRLDGLTAARRIRKLAGMERVPIVGCSAYEPENPENEAEAESTRTQYGQLNAFLRKPTDFSTLLTVMQYLLEQPPLAQTGFH
ncbi:MAG: response regulator [Acidobacteria bacterium]|nr:response regulator [Acidobacteriota bacterium]MBI3421923.1 response regulator [Acidobacteriota bacterium]